MRNKIVPPSRVAVNRMPSLSGEIRLAYLSLWYKMLVFLRFHAIIVEISFRLASPSPIIKLKSSEKFNPQLKTTQCWHHCGRFLRYCQRVVCYAALLPRRGPHIASHSVCLSVCPSVPLSSVTSRHVVNYNDTLRAAIVRPSRPHKLV